jgi:hypothetical protein
MSRLKLRRGVGVKLASESTDVLMTHPPYLLRWEMAAANSTAIRAACLARPARKTQRLMDTPYTESLSIARNANFRVGAPSSAGSFLTARQHHLPRP